MLAVTLMDFLKVAIPLITLWGVFTGIVIYKYGN